MKVILTALNIEHELNKACAVIPIHMPRNELGVALNYKHLSMINANHSTKPAGRYTYFNGIKIICVEEMDDNVFVISEISRIKNAQTDLKELHRLINMLK